MEKSGKYGKVLKKYGVMEFGKLQLQAKLASDISNPSKFQLYMYMFAYIINQLTFMYVPKVMYSCTSSRSPGLKIR